MPEPDRRPRCPKCGEPARVMSGLMWISFVLNPDMHAGTILKVDRRLSGNGHIKFRCGGGHTWDESS